MKTRALFIFWIFPILLLGFFTSNAFAYQQGAPKGVDFSSVWQAWDLIQKEFVDPKSLEESKLIIGLIKGLARGTGDSHTSFFTTEEFKKFLGAYQKESVVAEVFKVKIRRRRYFNIGYLKIKGFYDKTVEEVIEAGQEFKKNGVNGIILDLRGNTGGRVIPARGVCGVFLGPNKLVFSKTGLDNMKIDVFSFGNGIFMNLPTVCLVNRYSASASEIVAGALRDHRGVKLIGVKTYGKGSIQETKQIDIGTFLITTHRWKTPNGCEVNNHGLVPDIGVDDSVKGTKYKQDGQLDRAIACLLGK